MSMEHCNLCLNELILHIKYVNVSLCICRFPEGSLYHTEGSWKLLRIGEGPLGFGEYVCGPCFLRRNYTMYAFPNKPDSNLRFSYKH